MRKLVLFSSLVYFFISFLGCASDDKRADSAEGTYAIAQEYEKDERYEEALQYYNDVKNKFPYSRYAQLAELAVADIHFKREAYPEAQAAYQVFKEYHPRHERIAYVTYRLGLSYYHQLPSTVDRDLSLAQNAISSFNEIIHQYAKSEYAADSIAKRQEVLKMLAGKENYIAEFYFKRNQYDSALGRYEVLIKKYPRLDFDATALKGAALSAFYLGEHEKAQKYLLRLQSEHPDSSEARAAAREMRK